MTKSIKNILDALFNKYTVKDIWTDLRGWNINKSEATHRVRIIQDDFHANAEAEIIEYLAAEGEDTDSEAFVLAPDIQKLINQYSDIFRRQIIDEDGSDMTEFIDDIDFFLK